MIGWIFETDTALRFDGEMKEVLTTLGITYTEILADNLAVDNIINKLEIL